MAGISSEAGTHCSHTECSCVCLHVQDAGSIFCVLALCAFRSPASLTPAGLCLCVCLSLCLSLPPPLPQAQMMASMSVSELQGHLRHLFPYPVTSSYTAVTMMPRPPGLLGALAFKSATASGTTKAAVAAAALGGVAAGVAAVVVARRRA